MPPTGGIPLTPDQVRAVAAYVYALSHPEQRRNP
jgi:mono/diheme cytochrome c family protein